MKHFFQTWLRFTKRKFWVAVAIIMIINTVRIVTKRSLLDEAVDKYGLLETIVLLLTSVFLNGAILAIIVALIYTIISLVRKKS
jgi:uncharacterized membrane protein YhaH (DUF805 family)